MEAVLKFKLVFLKSNESSTSSTTELTGSCATHPKTHAATASRRAAYLTAIKSAVAAIQLARNSGAKNAREFAAFPNSNGVPAPTKGEWSESAVLRCLKRLKALKLDVGSNEAHSARRKFRASRRRRHNVSYPKLKRTTPSATGGKLHSASQRSSEVSGEQRQTSNCQEAKMDRDLQPQNSTTKNGRG